VVTGPGSTYLRLDMLRAGRDTVDTCLPVDHPVVAALDAGERHPYRPLGVARTRTLVAAAAVAGLALLGPRITAANTGVCSVGDPSTFTRFVGRSGVSSVIAARAR
jgi:hypothetical protein